MTLGKLTHFSVFDKSSKFFRLYLCGPWNDGMFFSEIKVLVIFLNFSTIIVDLVTLLLSSLGS